MSWWDRLRGSPRKAPKNSLRLQIVQDGFDLIEAASNRVVAAVRWAEVARVQTYKLDLVTTDSICLLFEFSDRRPPVQVSEEVPGFEELFEPLAAAFPTVPEGWYADVMGPAFAENRRVLYEAR